MFQLAQHIFIQRKWTLDKDQVTNNLRYFRESRQPTQLLLFPEGTILSETNRQKDRAFAEEKGLEVYKHLLNPHTTGFVHCVQQMSREGRAVAVCDLTIGFLGPTPQFYHDILAGILQLAYVLPVLHEAFSIPVCIGNWPSEVHFHVRHIQLPTGREQEELAEWLKSRWDEKEELLSGFSETKSFPGPELKEGIHVQLKMVASVLFWIGVLGAVFYSLVAVSYFWLYAVLMTALLVCVDKLFGGWDGLVLQIHSQPTLTHHTD